MNSAQSIMREANHNALIERENGIAIMIEDVTDPDGRMYRLEYQSTDDGKHAIAWCRSNPWGSLNAGEEYTKGHICDDGYVCVGEESVRSVSASSYSLSYVIDRARYWCTAFSALKETGTFPQL